MHSAIETWIFDLDNTLYSPATGLLDQINRRMTDFVMRELNIDEAAANAYRHTRWQSHGLTMNALISEHGVDAEQFLAETHDIDYGPLAPSPALRAAITALAGRKIVHTNGARDHAARVLARLDLSDVIDAVWAIEEAGFTPKPRPDATDLFIAAHAIAPGTAAMIEDSSANLAVPKARGMTTVLVTHDLDPTPGDHIDHLTSDLIGFLTPR
ncbi:MAG: pyrimidine 5'-nucleotidase [Pseudomonadota bacterium]